jgi:hypothetical protein
LTDHPAVLTDHPAVLTDHPAKLTDHPAVLTDHPAKLTDHPTHPAHRQRARNGASRRGCVPACESTNSRLTRVDQPTTYHLEKVGPE